jgi:predicted metallo-beta-lactamase superfamily hydrolase
MAWYSLVSDRVLFVNQRGQRVDEQTLDNLARLLASEQARIVTPEHVNLVDRAWSGALGSLRKLANRGARVEDQA